MNVCKACGKEMPEEALYYDYEDGNGKEERILLCPDCQEENSKIVECSLACMVYVSATSELCFRNKPVCRFCADYLIKHSNNYHGKDLADIKRLKEIREKSFN